jgi:hypothetical protein
MHALDLGVILEHRDAAAAQRDAVQPRQEEAHSGLEQLIDRKAVTLMGLICRPEYVVQFADQVMQFGRCLDDSFDCDARLHSAEVRSAP